MEKSTKKLSTAFTFLVSDRTRQGRISEFKLETPCISVYVQYTHLYRAFQKELVRFRENVPYVLNHVYMNKNMDIQFELFQR